MNKVQRVVGMVIKSDHRDYMINQVLIINGTYAIYIILLQGLFQNIKKDPSKERQKLTL